MKSKWIFYATPHWYKRILNRDGRVVCYTCGKPIKLKDKVVSTCSGKNECKRARHRHYWCAKKVNLV
jgi:hypothetical protein